MVGPPFSSYKTTEQLNGKKGKCIYPVSVVCSVPQMFAMEETCFVSWSYYFPFNLLCVGSRFRMLSVILV